MRLRQQLATRLTIAALLTAPLAFGACSRNRVYDPYYGDYHGWNSREDGFYRQWEVDTHRPHMAFDRRPAEEQHAYFNTRHGHR
jgi:hypothetical protein